MRFLILLALVAAAAAAPRSSQRVVGGETTTIEEYPYMASMQRHVFGVTWAQNCGGSLITIGTVLSAAHCFHGDDASLWRVLLGTSFPNSGGTQHAISALILHPEYIDFRSIDNDLAIVHLAIPATLSDRVSLVSIAGPNYNLPDGTPVTVSGWGTLTYDGESPTQLQHVDVNVINQELCAERYADLMSQPEFEGGPQVTDRMICSGILDVGGKSFCHGDSGGPLVHNGSVQVGIVSWGYDCAHDHYPGVYVRVSMFSEWIAATSSAHTNSNTCVKIMQMCFLLLLFYINLR